MRSFHPVSHMVRRTLLPIALLLYLALSVFRLQASNIYNNQFEHLEPYTGGPIDDIKRIKCSFWHKQCNQIVERVRDPDDNKIIYNFVWHRLPRDFDLNGEEYSYWFSNKEYLYVHIAPVNNENVKVIVDMAIGEPKSTEPPAYVIQDAKASIMKPKSRLDVNYKYDTWELRADSIWVKYDRASSAEVLNDLVYLFGEGIIEPRPDWSLVPGSLAFNPKRPFSLSFHRGDFIEPIIQLKESNHNYFKILQLSDFHFNSDRGICKDQYQKDPNCKADIKTLDFVNQVLDIEKPDLVVITGDLLDGSSTFDYQTAILKVLSPLIKRSIPYAIALSEKDIQNDYASSMEIIDFIAHLPFSLMNTRFKKSVNDITNYVIEIKDKGHKTLTQVIYILDHYKDSNQATKYLKEAYEKLETKPKLSLEFQHNPIKEYRPKGQFAIVGEYNERHTLSVKTDPETRKILSDINVQAISTGNEHTNECCIQSKDGKQGLNPLWMCFGSAVGEGGYGHSKMDRRVRLFRLNSDTMEITTWKRRQSQPNVVFDYQYLYGNES